MTRLKAALIGVGAIAVAAVLVVALLPRSAEAQGQTTSILMTATCDCQESSFGDLTADALQAAGNANLAFVGAISFRSGTLPPGPITLERVSTLLANPGEKWAVRRLTGAEIRAALEHAVRTAPLPNSSFLQVSASVSFQYSASGPRDQRVGTVLIGGAPLNDAQVYTVAMPLSLAKGGSGYFKIFVTDPALVPGNSSVAEAIVDYGRRATTVDRTGTGRITALP